MRIANGELLRWIPSRGARIEPRHLVSCEKEAADLSLSPRGEHGNPVRRSEGAGSQEAVVVAPPGMPECAQTEADAHAHCLSVVELGVAYKDIFMLVLSQMVDSK